MRLFHRIVIKGLILLLLVSAAALPLWAQPAPIPYHKEPYRLDSGVYEGLEAETALAFQEVIQVTGAPWLRVHISDCNLGQKSYITFTSLQDGGWQRLDSKTVSQWGYTSAYLNGDAVLVELHAASGEQGLFFRVEEITVGEWLGAAAGDEKGGGRDSRDLWGRMIAITRNPLSVISLVADHSPRLGRKRRHSTLSSRDDDFDHSYHTDVVVGVW